jgi:hypothetical protein
MASLDALNFGAPTGLDPDPLPVTPHGDPVAADRHPNPYAVTAQSDELVEGDPEFGRLTDL